MHVHTHKTHPPTAVGHGEENKHAPVFPTPPSPEALGSYCSSNVGVNFMTGIWVLQRNDSNGHRRNTQSAWELENKRKNEYSREEGEGGGRDPYCVEKGNCDLSSWS